MNNIVKKGLVFLTITGIVVGIYYGYKYFKIFRSYNVIIHEYNNIPTTNAKEKDSLMSSIFNEYCFGEFSLIDDEIESVEGAHTLYYFCILKATDEFKALPIENKNILLNYLYDWFEGRRFQRLERSVKGEHKDCGDDLIYKFKFLIFEPDGTHTGNLIGEYSKVFGYDTNVDEKDYASYLEYLVQYF